MRRTLIPARSGDVRTRAVKLRSDCSAALTKFCKDKVIEFKLAPRTFDFNFQFRGRSTEINRSIVRLKSLFGRALEKKVPYIEYAEDPFFKVIDRSQFSITLKSLPELFPGSYYNFETRNLDGLRVLCLSSQFGKTLQRYTRYLQFLCLKYELPFSITPSFNVVLSPESQRIRKTVTPQQRRVEAPEIQYSVDIRITLVHSVYNPYVEQNESLLNRVTMDEFVQQRLEETSATEVYNPVSWSHSPVSYGHHPNGYTPPRRWAIEKIFFYVPNILRVLRTLTRMTTYVPTAFSIGATESS